jgi:hypothetical protein
MNEITRGALDSDQNIFTIEFSAVGPQGVRGNGWTNGFGPPVADGELPGDLYLDDDSGDFYSWDGVAWTVVGNMEGPVGPAGPVGPPGSMDEAPMDGDTYGRKNGLWSEIPTAELMKGEWTFDTTTVAPPDAGDVRLDNATQPSATTMWIHKTTTTGSSAGNFLSLVKRNQELYLQAKDDPSKWQAYLVSGDPVDAGTYWTFPLTFDKGGLDVPAGPVVMTALAGVGGSQVAWADITDKPTTFPPTVPIAQADVTDLVTDLAGKEPAIAIGTPADYWAGDKTWKPVADLITGAGIGEAPMDGEQYARQMGDWSIVTGAVEEAPIDGTPYARQDGGWVAASTGGGFASTIDMAAFAGGLLQANEIIFRFEFTHAVTVPIGLAASQGSSGTAATASTVLTLRKNGTSFGTATWAAAGTEPTLAAASATSFAIGDVFSITAPATPDATLADVSLTVVGTI